MLLGGTVGRETQVLGGVGWQRVARWQEFLVVFFCVFPVGGT